MYLCPLQKSPCVSSKQKHTAKSDCHDTTPAYTVVYSKKDEQISTMVQHATKNIYVELWLNGCDCAQIPGILSYDDRRIFLLSTTQSTLHQNAEHVTSKVVCSSRILDLTMKKIFRPRSLQPEITSNSFLMKNQRNRSLQEKRNKEFRGLVL